MTLLERVKSPTPRFFKILRNVGLCISAIGGSLLGAPVVLPAVVVTIAGYMMVVGGVIGIVSQAAVGDE